MVFGLKRQEKAKTNGRTDLFSEQRNLLIKNLVRLSQLENKKLIVFYRNKIKFALNLLKSKIKGSAEYSALINASVSKSIEARIKIRKTLLEARNLRGSRENYGIIEKYMNGARKYVSLIDSALLRFLNAPHKNRGHLKKADYFAKKFNIEMGNASKLLKTAQIFERLCEQGLKVSADSKRKLKMIESLIENGCKDKRIGDELIRFVRGMRQRHLESGYSSSFTRKLEGFLKYYKISDLVRDPKTKKIDSGKIHLNNYYWRNANIAANPETHEQLIKLAIGSSWVYLTEYIHILNPKIINPRKFIDYAFEAVSREINGLHRNYMVPKLDAKGEIIYSRRRMEMEQLIPDVKIRNKLNHNNFFSLALLKKAGKLYDREKRERKLVELLKKAAEKNIEASTLIASEVSQRMQEYTNEKSDRMAYAKAKNTWQKIKYWVSSRYDRYGMLVADGLAIAMTPLEAVIPPLIAVQALYWGARAYGNIYAAKLISGKVDTATILSSVAMAAMPFARMTLAGLGKFTTAGRTVGVMKAFPRTTVALNLTSSVSGNYLLGTGAYELIHAAGEMGRYGSTGQKMEQVISGSMLMALGFAGGYAQKKLHARLETAERSFVKTPAIERIPVKDKVIVAARKIKEARIIGTRAFDYMLKILKSERGFLVLPGGKRVKINRDRVMEITREVDGYYGKDTPKELEGRGKLKLALYLEYVERHTGGKIDIKKILSRGLAEPFAKLISMENSSFVPITSMSVRGVKYDLCPVLKPKKGVRNFVLIFISNRGITRPVLYYRSGSSTSWRALPARTFKGRYYKSSEGEMALGVPWEIQMQMDRMALKAKETRVKSSSIDELSPSLFDMGKIRDYRDLAIAEQRMDTTIRGIAAEKRAPEVTLDTGVSANHPDFNNVLGSWKAYSEIYGNFTKVAVQSKNGKFIWLFSVTDNGAFVSSVEVNGGTPTNYGIAQTPKLVDSLDVILQAPIMEYGMGIRTTGKYHPDEAILLRRLMEKAESLLRAGNIVGYERYLKIAKNYREGTHKGEYADVSGFLFESHPLLRSFQEPLMKIAGMKTREGFLKRAAMAAKETAKRVARGQGGFLVLPYSMKPGIKRYIENAYDLVSRIMKIKNIPMRIWIKAQNIRGRLELSAMDMKISKADIRKLDEGFLALNSEIDAMKFRSKLDPALASALEKAVEKAGKRIAAQEKTNAAKVKPIETSMAKKTGFWRKVGKRFVEGLRDERGEVAIPLTGKSPEKLLGDFLKKKPMFGEAGTISKLISKLTPEQMKLVLEAREAMLKYVDEQVKSYSIKEPEFEIKSRKRITTRLLDALERKGVEGLYEMLELKIPELKNVPKVEEPAKTKVQEKPTITVLNERDARRKQKLIEEAEKGTKEVEVSGAYDKARMLTELKELGQTRTYNELYERLYEKWIQSPTNSLKEKIGNSLIRLGYRYKKAGIHLDKWEWKGTKSVEIGDPKHIHGDTVPSNVMMSLGILCAKGILKMSDVKRVFTEYVFSN